MPILVKYLTLTEIHRPDTIPLNSKSKISDILPATEFERTELDLRVSFMDKGIVKPNFDIF